MEKSIITQKLLLVLGLLGFLLSFIVYCEMPILLKYVALEKTW